MKKLFRKLFPNKSQDALRVQLVKSTDLRLDQWRKDENLVSQMASLEHNQTFIMAMAVLRNCHPVLSVLPLGTSPNDRVVIQSRCEGYEYCLNNLASMSKPFKAPKQVESTFAKPE